MRRIKICVSCEHVTESNVRLKVVVAEFMGPDRISNGLVDPI